MADRTSGAIWIGLGIAAGAALTVRKIQRWQRAIVWDKQWDTERRGVALVTGASSGIGEVYARRLAERHFDLILVARRAEKLRILAQELTERSGVRVEILPADLSDDHDIACVESRLSQGDVTFLVNNAGYGIPDAYVRTPIDKTEAMIRVHVLASVRFARAVLPGMLKSGRGAIVNVASMAAFLPASEDITYGPTKSYLKHFSESLDLTLVGTGIRVQALCPGFTVTGFHSTPLYRDIDVHDNIPDILWLDVKQVVDESLRCLETGEVVCVPGVLDKIAAPLMRIGVIQGLIGLRAAFRPAHPATQSCEG
jgi:uncharacterized protein